MKYTVTNEGPMEVHRIEIHQVDLAAAGGNVNRELYSKCRLSPSLSDQMLALALIVKAVEDEEKSYPQPATDETSDAIPFPKNGASE